MAGNAIVLKPGETLVVVATNPDVYPSHPIMLPGMPGWPSGPVDPGYSPPWAQVPGGGQPPLGIWGPGDPRPTNPIANPGNPAYPGGPPYPSTGPGFPTHPIVIPPTEPPPTQPPTDGDEGNWVWAWSPQAGRWVWVKVPGEGEPGPKTA